MFLVLLEIGPHLFEGARTIVVYSSVARNDRHPRIMIRYHPRILIHHEVVFTIPAFLEMFVVPFIVNTFEDPAFYIVHILGIRPETVPHITRVTLLLAACG